ncbi:hypothetical protein NEPAR04_2217 [Nematocida parisii]|nr:hypothetical protein NEPAR04_2217 [Nematocida parisii]
MVHQQGIPDSSDTEDSDTSSPKNTTAEEKDQPILNPCAFESEAEYVPFRQLWTPTPTPTPTPLRPAERSPLHQEQAFHTADQSADLSVDQTKGQTITRQSLEGAEASRLADSLPVIEQLSIWCKHLEGTAKDSLKKHPA